MMESELFSVHVSCSISTPINCGASGSVLAITASAALGILSQSSSRVEWNGRPFLRVY